MFPPEVAKYSVAEAPEALRKSWYPSVLSQFSHILHCEESGFKTITNNPDQAIESYRSELVQRRAVRTAQICREWQIRLVWGDYATGIETAATLRCQLEEENEWSWAGITVPLRITLQHGNSKSVVVQYKLAGGFGPIRGDDIELGTFLSILCEPPPLGSGRSKPYWDELIQAVAPPEPNSLNCLHHEHSIHKREGWHFFSGRRLEGADLTTYAAHFCSSEYRLSQISWVNIQEKCSNNEHKQGRCVYAVYQDGLILDEELKLWSFTNAQGRIIKILSAKQPHPAAIPIPV